ncbi:MAG: diaminopimelate dehydrogenase [Bacteroidales bacterium]|nr:diaminopimelate dehydrogenase [Bacteroidales bacterium]MBO7488009.1 diaminopimelate dehydrogenase [Bacteroidales bacterium]
MKKIRAAVVGYGNIGKYALEALQAAEDFEIAGVVRRNASDVPASLAGIPVVSSLKDLKDVEVAILATPTRKVEQYALEALSLGISTVDSFDIHTKVPALRKTLGEAARKAGKVSIISAGWDPGSDSMVRAILQAAAPKGITYTNFGPGMSMGHSVACKAIEGVKDALSMTIPMGTGVHRRMVYVELLPGADFEKVAAAIKADPYFVNDETYVHEVPSVDELKDMGHGVNLVRKGVSGKTHDQLFEFNMHINNPALTGQILVAVARAATRQAPGCYTMIELAPVDMLPGDRDEWVAKLV